MMEFSVLLALVVTSAVDVRVVRGGVYTTYHWHMQQPIYWPDKIPSNTRTYQKAFDSLQLQSSQGNHPQQNIDDIFGKECF
jgi:hypothetical protein